MAILLQASLAGQQVKIVRYIFSRRLFELELKLFICHALIKIILCFFLPNNSFKTYLDGCQLKIILFLFFKQRSSVRVALSVLHFYLDFPPLYCHHVLKIILKNPTCGVKMITQPKLPMRYH